MAYLTDRPTMPPELVELARAGREIPDFSHPAPRRHAVEDAFADARLSGARRIEPNAPGMGTLPPQKRADVLLKLEAAAQAEAKAIGAQKSDNCKFDVVQRPEHYASGGVECIDAIAAAMSVEAFRGYLRGNAIKYLWRYERKGGLEDLRKAAWYLDRLQRSIEPTAA